MLFSTSELGGGLTAFSVDSALDPLRFVDERAYDRQFQQLVAPQTALIDLPSGYWIVPVSTESAGATSWKLMADGSIGAIGQPLDTAVIGTDLVEIGQFATVSGQFLYTARKGSLQLATFKIEGNGTLTAVSTSPMVLTSPLRDATLDSIVPVTVNGNTILVTVSALGNFIATHQVSPTGQLLRGEYMGMGSGTGFNLPRDVVSVSLDGKTFLIMSSSATSSLTTFRIGPDGSIVAIDHVIDELSTRFQYATALATVTVDGRAYIFAGGADDGISMFLLQPDGKLMHLDTVGGDANLSLADVTDIEATVIDGKIVLFVSSAGDAGIAQFVIEPGPVGMTVTTTQRDARGTDQDDYMVAGAKTVWMHGGVGNDTLVAGENSIAMLGGAGEDVFVASNIKGRIAIKDFEVGVDRLDLSQLGMVRSIYQLSIKSETYGARVWYGDAVIDIMTLNGTSLAVRYFTNDMFPIAHYAPPGLSTVIYGTSGADLLRASRGGSRVYGQGGNDVIFGADIEDTIYGGRGRDVVDGGFGADSIFGQADHDRLRGNTGRDTIQGGQGNDTIMGDDGDDQLFGSTGHDVILGGTGNDHLSGGSGNDYLQGQDGDDRLLGDLGNDRLNGGIGNDTLIDTSGNNRLYGHDDDDLLIGGVHRDTLDGGNGNDTLRGDTGVNILLGGAGDDKICGGAGNDRARGGYGADLVQGDDGDDFLHGAGDNDTVQGGAGLDTLLGGDGNDLLEGGAGNDTLIGHAGKDTLRGGDGDDRLRGVLHDDALYGEAGNDWLNGGGGNDLVDGGEGTDTLLGDAGNDTVLGMAGNDYLSGGSGNDAMDGGNGNDRLNGDGGDDTLLGGLGADTILGGAGLDIFGYRSTADSSAMAGIDLIADFTQGDDLIDLGALDLVFVNQDDFSAAGQLRFAHVNDQTHVLADLDGDLLADFQIILGGTHYLDARDFIL